MTLSLMQPAVTVAEADAYAEARVWSNWTGSDTAKTGALRRSQDYIAANYNRRWKDEWDNDHAPDEVKFAIIEGARRELVSPGSLSPDVVAATARKRVKVEGAVEIEYAVGANGISAADMRPDIAIIDALLVGLLVNGSSTMIDLLRY